MSSPTYYDVLGVDPSSEAKEIRKAYLRSSLKHHPDKNPGNVEEAKARFVEIGEAWETLRDEQLRRRYDATLRQRSGGSSAYRPSGSAAAPTTSSDGDTGYRPKTSPKSYDSYRDVFDETVAGLSEAELAAAMGVLSVVGSFVGSMVGSRMGNNTGSRFLGTAGSMAGSALASQVAGNAFRSLHQESVARVAYKQECKRCVERGMPMPEPPPRSKWQDALEKTMASVQEHVTKRASTTNTRSAPGDDSSDDASSRRKTWHEKVMDKVDNAQTRAAAAAAVGVASSLWQNANSQAFGNDSSEQPAPQGPSHATADTDRNSSNRETDCRQRGQQQTGSWQDQMREQAEAAQNRAAQQFATRTAEALWKKAKDDLQKAASGNSKKY